MKKKKRLIFNSPAPDVTLKDTAGNDVNLSDLWQEKTLLLAFTRHFGCTQCKEMLDVLVENRAEIEGSGLGIAVVMQGDPEESAAFAKTYARGLRVLSDPTRSAYDAYGLERGTIFQTVINRRVWQAVSRAKKKGYAIEPPPPNQDAMQMSGTFIISTEGKVMLPYYYDDIADHPKLELLLSGVLSTRWNALFEGPVGPGVNDAGSEA